jgi:hypothetical protein
MNQSFLPISLRVLSVIASKHPRKKTSHFIEDLRSSIARWRVVMIGIIQPRPELARGARRSRKKMARVASGCFLVFKPVPAAGNAGVNRNQHCVLPFRFPADFLLSIVAPLRGPSTEFRIFPAKFPPITTNANSLRTVISASGKR